MAQTKTKRRARASDAGPDPRATVPHNWDKDDEELELEEALFGKSKKRVKADHVGDEQDDFVVDEEGDVEGLSDLEDNELFTVDAPLAPQYQLDLEGEDSDAESSSSGSSSSSSASAANEFRAFSPSPLPQPQEITEERELQEETGKNAPTITLPDDLVDLELEAEKEAEADRKGKGKVQVWNDPADDLVGVDMSENRRLRKLDRGKKGKKVEGEAIDGKELQLRLKEQFERLHPPPAWAKNRTVVGTPSLSSLLSSTKSFIAGSVIGKTRAPLPQGTIDLQRMRNANQQNPTVGKREAANAGGGVMDFAWHPAKSVGVMAVAGGDRRVRFFNIDGHTNPTLMTLHIPALPISRATFHPSGSSLLIVGNRPFYYTYDLGSQRCLRSPRNLFGSQETPSTPNSLHRHSFSPDGSLLAVAGRRGAVSILDWSSGAGAVVAELRSGRGGSVADLNWSTDGKELNVLGGRDGGEVEVWDVGERKIGRRWKDDRALGGTVLRSSQDGAYTAIGSTTGIVNLYSSSSLTSNTTKLVDLAPEPVKSLEHLTMPIASMAFHPSSELLVTASTGRKDLLKLYHLPSGTAFSNWPTLTTPLGRVTTTGFSTSGEYLAVGNQKGSVLLWSLRHYT
ncbi:hypothetical protein CI109_100071 [Kwoniella shandongensis]|uniref:Uncharacterized protein n=1 Tax=Kwoniella shandongensis TaxID=1734106 RepID=A0A5M6BRW9_9TREE|nr:uncharacterized protein CI109_005956 [Kwoniella shandongensis]KAA5525648.1 hypothetical protein CI109_005956 [Kwoniella shandongensis]